MYVADRISRWAMGVGVKQLTLSHESGFKFADHLRHLHHHLKALRVERVWNTRGMNDVQLSLHLLECSKVLSKISFEASLIPLDIDYNELEDIQHDISRTLKLLEDDHDIIDLPSGDFTVLEIQSPPD